MLNQDQIRFYRENGYLVVAEVFGAEELEALGRVTAGSVEATRGVSASDGVFVGAIDPAAPGGQLDRAVALTDRAGACKLHHVRTLHGSAENASPRPRPLLLFSYAAVDAWPLVERFDLEAFDGRILRGAPTLEPRQVALPVRIPLPRVPAADSIFDDQAAVASRSFGSAPQSTATQEGAT